MDTNNNQLSLVLGTTITVYLKDGGSLTAEAFKTLPVGVYLDKIKGCSPHLHSRLIDSMKENTLAFFPYQNIDFITYDVVVEKEEKAPEPPKTPQG